MRPLKFRPIPSTPQKIDTVGRLELTEQPTAKNTARQESGAARLAGAISKGILRRQFVVGQRLVEADLMRDFGVSRSTVREALKMLAANGIVEIHLNRGAVVRSLNAKEAQDLLQVIELLTGLAARLAARHIDRPGNRERFEAAAHALAQASTPEDFTKVLDGRAPYYQVIFDIAGNEELARIIPLSRIYLFRMQFHSSLTPQDIKAMVAEYRAVTEAILAGDPARAEARMQRHIQKSAERTLPRYGGLET